MNWKSSRRTLLLGAGVLVLIGGAFAAGAWVGADFVGKFFGYQVLPRASANANLLHGKLLLLDKGDYKVLREQLNIEVDSELLSMCMLVKDPTGSSADAVERARTILRRVAQYRRENPPLYPAGWIVQVGEEPTKMLRECLASALETTTDE